MDMNTLDRAADNIIGPGQYLEAFSRDVAAFVW